MRSLADLDEAELVALADGDFQESVQSEARKLVPDAITTYEDVMLFSDDDQARIKAADKVLAIAGYQEKQATSLPSGITPETFALALMGLGQLAGIAQSSALAPQILKNVTPARTDPRIALPDPMTKAAQSSVLDRSESDNDQIISILQGERFEIRDRQDE